jgi:CheY-like chemotaxis protein
MRLENETGEEVIKAIRKQKDSQNTNTPTVVISGYLDKKLMSGVAKYIQGALVKPFELSKLLEIVKKNLA